VAKKKANRLQVSSWRIVMTAIVVAVIAKSLVIDLVIVRGESMVPTIGPGTVAVVLRCAYGLWLPVAERYAVRWAEPRPGDVVLLSATANQSRRAIKRVFEVGPAFIRLEAGMMEGRGGFAETGASASLRMGGSRFVPADRVFVVGDNEAVSRDSREYGPVPIENITGKVLLYSSGHFRTGSKTESSKDAADDVDR
jgi:signal peptidase I